MEKLFALFTVLIQLNSSSYSTKICVKHTGYNWLARVAGEWVYNGQIHDAPSYKQTVCKDGYDKPKDCPANPRTLALDKKINLGGVYKFFDPDYDYNPFCDDGKHPLRPEYCTHYWGWGDAEYQEYGPYIVYACGEEQTPAPTTPAPTIPLPRDTTTEYNWNKPDEYNLINPYPESYFGKDQLHFAQEIYSQTDNKQDLTHPNYEERLTATLINMARLFPDQYRSSDLYGGNSFNYYTGQAQCGKPQSEPLYYSQKGNEAARFHNYDQLTCKHDAAYSAEYNGMIHAHLTCNNPYRCSQFSGYTTASGEPECTAGTRWTAFMAMKPENGAHLTGGEGICGANGCYEDGHCGAMFDNNEWIGIGKWKGSSGYDILYGSWTETDKTPKKYPIVYGAHLDSRYYWNHHTQKEIEASANQVKFLLQWYGAAANNAKASSVHLLFENNEHTMTRILGDESSGFYEIDMTMHSDNKYFCEPYAFIVETTDGNKYRLPENDKYFFGTAFFDSYGYSPLYECDENHYFKNDNNVWIANGGPLNLIASNVGCIGCSKANALNAF